MNSNLAIDLLGGTHEAAKFFEVTPGAISQWRKDGIPRARLMYLRAMRPDIYAAASKMRGDEMASDQMKDAA